MEASDVSNLAIVPARGGSRGLPRKNVCLLAGKPLIVYTIEAALHASHVDRIIVSTDDPEIAAISEQAGAETVWRPKEISGDTAPSELALLHTLDHLKKVEGYEPQIIVFLQCTSPLTLPKDIDGTVQALFDQKADSSLAVTPFHYFLWQWDVNGGAIGVNHDKLVRPLRQERDLQYLETGAVYVMRTKGFKEARHRFFGKTAMHVMPPERCLEIDEPVQLAIAEFLLSARLEGDKWDARPSSKETCLEHD